MTEGAYAIHSESHDIFIGLFCKYATYLGACALHSESHDSFIGLFCKYVTYLGACAIHKPWVRICWMSHVPQEEAAAKGRVELPVSHRTYLHYLQELAEHGGTKYVWIRDEWVSRQIRLVMNVCAIQRNLCAIWRNWRSTEVVNIYELD